MESSQADEMDRVPRFEKRTTVCRTRRRIRTRSTRTNQGGEDGGGELMDLRRGCEPRA